MPVTGRVASGTATTRDTSVLSRSRVAMRGGVRLTAAGAVLAAAVLAGCGSDDSDADAAPPATATTTAASGASTGGGYGGGGGASTAPPATSPATSEPAGGGAAVEQGALTIDDFAFTPANPTFRVGQTVLVTNNDSVAHTWTSADGGFDTGLIQPGASATVTLSKAGTFDFVCTPHAGVMKGVVTVTA